MKTKREVEIENLRIDLREINWILENRPNIMCSEYVELGLAKREIIKRLMNHKYEPNLLTQAVS